MYRGGESSVVDISKNDLYIKALHQVIASSMPYRTKLNVRENRPSDCFVFVLEGGCTYRFQEGTRFSVSPGDILYLAAGASYTMELHPSGYGYIFCDFDFTGAEKRACARCAARNPGETQARFRRLRRAYRQRQNGSFTEGLSLLYEIYGDFRAGAEGAYVDKSARSRLEESRRRIDLDYADLSLSVRSLAEGAGMSEVYFRKLFRALYADSPSSYLSFVRLQAAEEMMLYTALPLREIAGKSGYSSVQYFCRAFKKKRGVSPSRWRRENRVTTP